MNILAKTGLLLTLVAVGCCCCEDVPPYLDIQKMNVYNYSNGGGIILGQDDSIAFRNFGIEVVFDGRYYSKAILPQISFIPTAMANSCNEAGYKGSKENIEKVEITALQDYNQQFKAGDLLNTVVEAEGTPIDLYVMKHNLLFQTIELRQFNFTSKPDSKEKIAFRVYLKLTNGEEYVDETEPVRIY